MKLNSKIFLMLIGIIILPLIVGISFTFLDIKTSIKNLEVSNGKNNITNVDNYFDQLKNSSGESHIAWTLWTEYYDAVSNQDLTWIKENVLASAKEDTFNEVILTLDSNAKLMAQINSPKDWTTLDFKNFDLLKKINATTNYVSGIEKTSDGLYITTIVKLVASDDSEFKNPDGYTIYARKMTEALLKRGKDVTGVNIALKLDDGTIISTDKNLSFENSSSKSFSSNEVKAYSTTNSDNMLIKIEKNFSDFSGNSLGVLHIEDTSKAGSVSLNKLEKDSAVLIVILIFSIILVCILILKIIIKPINLIASEAQLIANGDLTSNKSLIDTHRAKDEIGQITTAFVAMRENLKGIIFKVKQLSENVADLSSNIFESAKTNSSLFEEIAKSTNIMAEGASRQITQVVNIQDNISVGVVKAKEAYDQASKMLDTSKFSTEIAEEGRNQIFEVIKQYEWFSTTVEFATSSIKNLSIRSNEIAEINSLIKSVTSQTNLLALNASIEAARAGESGKGFSVVAEEIRKLATNSSDASKSITDLIEDIQAETFEAVKTMETNLEKVNNQLDSIRNGEEALEIIVNQTKETENSAIELYNIYIEIKKMLEHINSSVNEISNGIRDDANYSQEVATSSENQISSMEHLNSVAENLDVIAENLKKEINRFKSE